LFLLEQGYEVTAVDSSPRALEIVRSRAPEEANLRLIEADMSELELPNADVIVAGFSLFFLDQEKLERFWPRLVAALKPGGLFAGQFLGVNDEWADKGHALVDNTKLREMLSGFDLIHFDEVEREGETALGNPKHWHVFHVVARKAG